jgi:dolichyl-phosphate beta-glucosyltransferase
MNHVPTIALSLVIPAYNEEGVILKTLAEVFAYFKSKGSSFEVLVVDDGSEDKTAELVEELNGSHPELRLLSLRRNTGKGAAIKYGVEHAQGERILFMDADHSVSIDHLENFQTELDRGYDIAIASIELEGAVIHDVHHKVRRMAGKLSKVLIQVVAVKGKHDTQRGFKLFTREAAKELFSRLSILRWGFDIEILVMAQRKGMRIKEMPVVWHNNKKSAIGIGDYLRTFFELLQIRINASLGRYN